MKPSVIIIGTNHPLQAGDNRYAQPQLDAFANLIEKTARTYRIKSIAEEMSVDVLSDFGVTETIAKKVADRKRVVHRYVDLTACERERLSIDRLTLHHTAQSAKLGAPQFAFLERTTEELRESLWLVRVLSLNTWPTLFICGANHGSRIQHLFNAVGKLAVLEVNDFGV